MMFRGFLVLAALLLGALMLNAAEAQQDAEGARSAGEGDAASAANAGVAFAVEGIQLDVRAATVEQARDAAFREAPRQAWPRLWARMTGNEIDEAPAMTDAALDAMIESIEVEAERFGDGRYIATLGVIFERTRAGRRLPAGARVLQSGPLLLIPLLTDAGAASTLDPDSAWFAAWQEFSTGASVIDYVRPQATVADRILLGSWQALRDDRALWRAALAKYDADNVLVAEARLIRSYPGGPVTGQFVARYGPDSTVLQTFTLSANGTAGISDMLADAIKRIDGIYSRALQDGTIVADDSLSVALAPIEAPAGQLDDGFTAEQALTATVVTPEADDWTRIRAVLDQVPQVAGFTLETLNIGGTSIVRIAYAGELANLRYSLDSRGLRLEPGEAGYRLRPRIEGEAPLPPPAIPSPSASPIPDPANTRPGSDPATPPGSPPSPTTPDAPDAENAPESLLPDIDG
jgi:hypothetical protein|tara:strand:+ start:179513 stop:180898 length:1386 start_codon:yes stop_codon:yes gene_type:complete